MEPLQLGFEEAFFLVSRGQLTVFDIEGVRHPNKEQRTDCSEVDDQRRVMGGFLYYVAEISRALFRL